MSRSFDVVVVGAGLAGCCAALTAVRKGLSVALIERGKRPGSKNVIGGILYTTVLDRLFPDFAEAAPIERHIVSRSFGFLTDSSHMTFEVRSGEFDQPPLYNHSYTVRRTVFDPWLVEQARKAGVMVVPSTVVDGVILQGINGDSVVCGVHCGRIGGEIGAKVTIIAEGANALLAEQAAFRPKTTASQAMLGVKEILRLDRPVLEERFGLEGNGGRGFEFYGAPSKGGFGSGFLYTNLNTLSVGVAVSLTALTRLGRAPSDLLEEFKAHPSLRPWIRGAEPVEYCAHLLPIGNAAELPELVRNGAILAGDAARLANMSHYKEITNLVTFSGVAAGEAAAEAIECGNTTVEGLAGYRERLENSFVMKDLKKYSRLAGVLEETPELLERYPRLMVEAFVKHFTLSGQPKDVVEKEMLRAWNKEARPSELRRHMFLFLEATGFSMMPLLRRMALPGWEAPWRKWAAWQWFRKWYAIGKARLRGR